MKQRLSRLKELLNLSPDTNEFVLISGRTPQSPIELAIQSRSLMEIMLELSTYIDIPQKDLDEGRIQPTLDLSIEEKTGMLPPIRIHSSTHEPADAYLSVRYRDHWFYIDDRSPRSKGMLMFVMMLFSFAETGDPSAAPVVTIPTG